LKWAGEEAAFRRLLLAWARVVGGRGTAGSGLEGSGAVKAAAPPRSEGGGALCEAGENAERALRDTGKEEQRRLVVVGGFARVFEVDSYSILYDQRV